MEFIREVSGVHTARKELLPVKSGSADRTADGFLREKGDLLLLVFLSLFVEDESSIVLYDHHRYGVVPLMRQGEQHAAASGRVEISPRPYRTARYRDARGGCFPPGYPGGVIPRSPVPSAFPKASLAANRAARDRLSVLPLRCAASSSSGWKKRSGSPGRSASVRSAGHGPRPRLFPGSSNSLRFDRTTARVRAAGVHVSAFMPVGNAHGDRHRIDSRLRRSGRDPRTAHHRAGPGRKGRFRVPTTGAIPGESSPDSASPAVPDPRYGWTAPRSSGMRAPSVSWRGTPPSPSRQRPGGDPSLQPNDRGKILAAAGELDEFRGYVRGLPHQAGRPLDIGGLGDQLRGGQLVPGIQKAPEAGNDGYGARDPLLQGYRHLGGVDPDLQGSMPKALPNFSTTTGTR